MCLLHLHCVQSIYIITSSQSNLLLKEVLSVLKGAKFELFVLVLQLLLGRSEVENEVLQGEYHCIHR